MAECGTFCIPNSICLSTNSSNLLIFFCVRTDSNSRERKREISWLRLLQRRPLRRRPRRRPRLARLPRLARPLRPASRLRRSGRPLPRPLPRRRQRRRPGRPPEAVRRRAPPELGARGVDGGSHQRKLQRPMAAMCAVGLVFLGYGKPRHVSEAAQMPQRFDVCPRHPHIGTRESSLRLMAEQMSAQKRRCAHVSVYPARNA